jgi:hypothetical protein
VGGDAEVSSDPFIYGPARVAIEADDWAAADGAMVTADDQVVPMHDMTHHLISFEITFDDEAGE